MIDAAQWPAYHVVTHFPGIDQCHRLSKGLSVTRVVSVPRQNLVLWINDQALIGQSTTVVSVVRLIPPKRATWGSLREGVATMPS